MRSAYARWLLVAALSTAGSAVASGCANDQETINRVQPNALEKSSLDGEWYYLQTVIDTPATSTYTFVGDQGDVKKIRWEIQENYLIARRLYENVAGAEAAADTANDAANTALAMYKIESHFDVRRDYNPATGEQTNVVAENTVDRPWRDRQFMRVDWSENLITDGQFMLIQRVLDGIETESTYFVQTGDDAPQFVSGDDGKVNYVDIVNKMFVKPTTVTIPNFGKIPTCLLGGATDLCEDGEISVRNSFRKVVDTDYQPSLYTGDRMERFGFFVHERMGYSKDYGNIENERYRFAERHNLWQKSHRRNDEGKLLSCTAHSQCGQVAGSKCDTDWGRAKRRFNDQGEPLGVCTIPYREREVRPIVYYANNLPEELAADIDSIGNEWNSAFVETVSSLRENECLEAKGTNCAAERKREDHQRMFYLCQAPVPKGAPEACGEEGFKPKPGDLRYSQLFWVKGEEGGGPLGYGPGHSDPETGETLMGNAFVYGAGVERYAARARDIVMLLNGDLDVTQLQAGDYISDFAEAAHARASSDAEGARHAIEMSPEILAREVKHMDFSWANSDHVKHVPTNPGELADAVQKARVKLYEGGAYGRGVDEGAARLARLKDSDIEAMMITPDMRLAAGLNPRDTTLGSEIVEAASPLRGRSVDHIRAVERGREMLREKAGFYDADFQDEGLVGLAMEIQKLAEKGGSIEWYGRKYAVGDGKGKVNYEAVRTMVQHPMFHGLALHEIGHSIGLRHNFSGSFDALNYNKQYWKLRSESAPMAPRLWDPETDKERAGRIREYQYSTVMDYGNNFVVSDAVGIGLYDRAAIKMGYGDLVEVFTDAPNHARVASVSAIVRLGYPIMLDLEATSAKALNYTDWPSLVGGIGNIEKRADVPYTTLKADSSLAAQGLTDPAVDDKGRAAVPYLFCSDETANLNPDCTLYDAGADPYESIKSTIDAYWYYYPYTNFRRQRVGFSVGPVVDAVLNRYFDKLKSAHQINALYVPIFKDIFNLTDDAPFWTAQDGMGAWTAASLEGFKLLQHVITSPEPGGYGPEKRADGVDVLVPGARFPVDSVDSLDGRYLETAYDFDAGYFWFDQLDRVGYFHDKVMALVTLVDPTTYFVGRDTDADIRKYQINYGTTFGPSMKSFFRAVLAEDWSAIAPRFKKEDGKTTLDYPELSEIEKRNMAGTPIVPNVSFSIQLYAAVFGMGYIPQTYDQSFLNSSRLWAVGGAEEVAVDPSKTLVTFLDPDSGITYAAVSELDAEGVEQGVAASVLQYANVLFQAGLGEDGLLDTEDDDLGALDAGRRYVDNVDILRRLTWQLGFGAQP